MKDAYTMHDKEVLDRLANMHINFSNEASFKKYHQAMQIHDMDYLRDLLNDVCNSNDVTQTM
ncbi:MULTISPECIES: hypothetical protein [Staphylococcus]|uniref:Transposase n=1 Tax=Staphylococcus hsinchuensis TaxID=3051183 RepID=A0ABZ3EB71_9STAP|nr:MULTISPECIES: hypothetical protein [unclassified Staphylococcus]